MGAALNPIERRTHSRRNVCWRALWEADGNSELGEILNVNSRGIFLQPQTTSAKTLMLGSKVHICLFVPSTTRAVNAIGTVRHASGTNHGWGIEFDEQYEYLEQVPFGSGVDHVSQ